MLLSCESKVKFEKPENLLSKEEMIDLLTDMHLANATSGINNINEEKNLNYMALVYEKYGVDSVRFAESNLYYAANVDDYEKRLMVLKKEYQTEMDSILDEADARMKEGSAPIERINKFDN